MKTGEILPTTTLVLLITNSLFFFVINFTFSKNVLPE